VKPDWEVLVASLHQGIADILPMRLLHENWLSVRPARGDDRLAPRPRLISGGEGEAYQVHDTAAATAGDGAAMALARAFVNRCPVVASASGLATGAPDGARLSAAALAAPARHGQRRGA
jgi:hypothetical protein